MIFLLQIPSSQSPGGLIQPIVIVEDKNVQAAVVLTLPESGRLESTDAIRAYRNVLGLTGRPDIILVGSSSALAPVADALHQATGSKIILAPLSLPRNLSIGDGCKSTTYDRSVGAFLVSELLLMPVVSTYTLLLVLHVTSLATPVPCDPFQALHAAGGVFASGEREKSSAPAGAEAPSCALGLKAAIQREVSVDKVPLNNRYDSWADNAAFPAFQVLQVAFWTQPRIRSVLEVIGRSVAEHGWPAARIFDLIAAAAAPDAPGPIDLAGGTACSLAKIPIYAPFAVRPVDGGAAGLYLPPGTPESDRSAMLGGKYRAAFVAVVREAQVRRTGWTIFAWR